MTNFVYLELSIWPTGSHYYARLAACGGLKYQLEHNITDYQAKQMNKSDGSRNWRRGMLSNRFLSKEDAIAVAKQLWKKWQKDAKVLILGNSSIIEPQPVLVGPKAYKDKVNRMVEQFKEMKSDRLETAMIQDRLNKLNYKYGFRR